MQGTSLRQDYEQYGYSVSRGVVPGEQIDRLLALYKSEIVPSSEPFFRQSTNAYELSRSNAHGHVLQSFLDIHDYKRFASFSRAAIEIYTGAGIRAALQNLTGYDSFNLMQTMLFDANTATVPHQDCWYLDSVPNGELLASWIALEDIDERAGRFFVVPGSTSVDLHSDTPGLAHKDWLKRVATYVEARQEQLHAPALNKGDVLFWNSRTIHGSLPTQDPRFSRKSLTAHYLPSQFEYGNLFTVKPWIEYKTCNGMKFYRNQPDYSFASKLKSNVKTSAYNSPGLIRNLRKVQNLVERFK